MVNDLMGGLMQDLSGFLPEDDPNVKVMVAQKKLCDLQKQEEALYAVIGKQAVERDGLEAFAVHADQLKLVQQNILEAKNTLDLAVREQEERGIDESRRVCLCTCSCCGHENPDGTKYCERCGAKLLEWEKLICLHCGAELLPNALFCGQCGCKV